MKPGDLLVVGNDVTLEADDGSRMFCVPSHAPVVFVSQVKARPGSPEWDIWNCVTILTQFGILYVLRRDLQRCCELPRGSFYG